MRTLKFVVDGQKIIPDPNCDFTNLVPGSTGHLRARFTFSKEWENMTKVVGFYSRLGKEYTPQLLYKEESCEIPPEALEKRFFKIRVIGKSATTPKFMTNKLEIDQEGG